MLMATGIVRKIDGLGRVVIPKAVRERVGFQNDDVLEVYINEKEGTVTFKKVKFDE